MMQRIDPPIPLKTVKGNALAHFILDYGCEEDLFWVCFMDATGECWTFRNRDIRAYPNITMGRECVSPFYDPKDVAFKQVTPAGLEPTRSD